MQLFELISWLVVLCAALAYFNYRVLRLPGVIGLLVLSLGISVTMIFCNQVFGLQVSPGFQQAIRQLDFGKALIEIMLGFMLFAGSFHADAEMIWKEVKSIGLLAFPGTVLKTGLVAVLFYQAAVWVGMPLDFVPCLLFGALIAPTDPIAVLGILNRTKVEARVKSIIIGESLFNDGVGIVLFISISALLEGGAGAFSAGRFAGLFLQEAVGGMVLGAALGYVLFKLLKSVDDYEIAILLTLAAVMGGNLLANQLHVSGPLAMVVAGLITGSGRFRTRSANRDIELYLDKFWELVDLVLNALLFLLIGLHFVGLQYSGQTFLLGFLTIPMVVLASFGTVVLIAVLFKRFIQINRNEQVIITWSGLKGGLSLAMALSIPDQAIREPLVLITYAMVVFSIVIQGLSIERLAKRLGL
jgi:CPA1 family monovalent cation:H+ antiporter